jgi:hypothetical protein
VAAALRGCHLELVTTAVGRPGLSRRGSAAG